MVGVFAAAISGIVLAPQPAQADYATAGRGYFVNSVVWAEWGRKGDIIPAEGITKTHYTQVGSTTLAVECTLSQPASGQGYGYDQKTTLDVWTAGSFLKDGLDDLYNRGGTGLRNQITSGIHTKYSKTTVSFRVSCSAMASGPGFPAGGQQVPLGGMVVADAESSEPPGEYIKVETTGNAEWRILDRIRDRGCTSTTMAQQVTSGGSRSITLTPRGTSCPSTGPTVAAVASNVSEVTITMLGQGQSAAAVGAVINLDYGDAPASYGAAAAQYLTGWNGRPLPDGTTDAFAVPLAWPPRSPEVVLGRRIDPEPVNPVNGDGTQDDKVPVAPNDEDAISGTPLYHVMLGSGTANQEIVCTGSGYNRGWVDWNRNGVFDEAESSDTVQCVGGKSTLTWSIPEDAATGDSYLRLRAAARAESLASPTGLTVTGEVEDHKVQISTYELEISKTSDALAGKKFAGDEVTYTVTAKNPSRTPFTAANQAYVFDDLRGVADDATVLTTSLRATVTGSARGDVTFDADAARIAWQGTLDPGEMLTLTYRIRLKTGGDRDVRNVAWGQAGVATPATNVTCKNRTAEGHDDLTNYPCAAEQYGLMSLLKTFQSTYDPNPDASDWTLTATGNFGGEPDDTERVVPGATTATNANTFVVPMGETLRFTEKADPEVMKGYELLNPDVTAVGGDQAELLNKDKPASVTWRKTDSETGELVGGSQWYFSGPSVPGGVTVIDCVAADHDQCAGPDKDPKAGSFLLEDLRWGEHTLTETAPPPGYVLPDQPGRNIKLSSSDTGPDALDAGEIPNDHLPGSISWRKVEAGTTTPLAGSVWQLTDTSGTTITDITDCTASGACSGDDKDPGPGSFRVEGLAWGTWKLVETGAPLGYLLTTREESVPIGAQTVNQTVTEPFENTRATVPVLPLTGGTPSDIYYYSGGGLLAVAAALVLLRHRLRSKRT
jgi:hypothetical protein